MLQKTIVLLAGVLIGLGAAAQGNPADAGGARPARLLVSVFTGPAALAAPVSEVVRTDLQRAGAGNLLAAGAFPLGYNDPIAFDIFRERGVDVLVVGTARRVEDSATEVRFRTYDVARELSLGAAEIAPLVSTDLRRLGHGVADEVWRQLGGGRGVFSSRIALVVRREGRYLLQICEWDGSHGRTALDSEEPVLSLAWSPDGEQIGYTVIEGGRPVVYAQSLASGARRLLAGAPGGHSGPTWRPDGAAVALVSTAEGGSRIVETPLAGHRQLRLLRGEGAATEPAYSADGQQLYFTSDRPGTPQIYRLQLADGAMERLTYDGDYNVSPAVSPDARTLAYVTRHGGRQVLALMDLHSRSSRIVDDTLDVDAPSFSANGRFVAFTERTDGRGRLSIVTRDGALRLTLPDIDGDVLEAAWGPVVD